MNSQEIFETHIKYKKTQLIEHTKRVVELCEEFATELEKVKINGKKIEVNRPLLIHAAWLHDIAKFDDDKKHNEPKKVKAIIKKYDIDIDSELAKSIAYVISWHKGDEFEPKKHRKESAILRICDKLDKFNKGQADANKKCEKSMDLISDWAEDKKWIDDFRTIYEAKKDELKEKNGNGLIIT